ncbi:MAG: tetratricopeptide repeat protein [Candidatus Aminicenantes bacterium]|nr:tetratricopeptide repeat protein [Candidatus Aminicenantes bacterium]
MKRIHRIIISLMALVVFIMPMFAQEDGDPVSIGIYRKLHSKVLDEDRVLLVNLPRGYDETTIRYPVLYILYGGQVEGYFADAVHIVCRLNEASRIPDMIIVGVKNVDRYRDCLPINRNGEPGGAGNFLKFFTEELIPFIGQSYRTKDFRILLGPQAGAAFGLYALMENPGLFRVNIVMNPFWIRANREYMLEKAKDFFDQEGSLNNFLFMTTNTSDDNDVTMEYLQKFETVVENGKRSDFTLIINQLEKRESGFISSPRLREGLEAFFKDYRFPHDIQINGLVDLKAYYKNLSQKYGYQVDIPEFTLVRQGDRLDERGKLEEAKIVFEYIVEKYPHDLNSYARLADLHRRWGNYELALQYYEQLLERRRMPFIEGRLNSLKRYLVESAAYEIEKAITDSGIDAGIAKFLELGSDDDPKFTFRENDFISLGYYFMTRGNIGAAVEVFKMNVEMNPQSANAYDSLGEAYLKTGYKEKAVKNYKKSLELNPDNDNAKKILKELEKK